MTSDPRADPVDARGDAAPPDERPAEAEEQRVTSLELFFDLVFVFTMTQLTGLLAGDLSVATALRVALIFLVLFWMYGGYAWLTNQVPPVLPARRLLLICGMGAFLVCALAIPTAFGDGGVAFGAGYLLVVLVHAGLYASVHGRVMAMWVGPFNLAAALCVLAAGLVGGAAAYALWAAAVAIHLVMPYANRSPARPDIRTGHFVERHGLLLLIALGESVVAIGIGVSHEPLSPRLFLAVLLGLALAATLWWSYFAHDEESAERALEAIEPLPRRLLRAVRAYYWCYVPMLLGIVALAAGVKLSIGHVTERLTIGPALTLAGGVALYLAGEVAFRQALGIRPIAVRAVAAVAALSTVALGITTDAAVQLVVLLAILLGMLVPEMRSRRPAYRPVPPAWQNAAMANSSDGTQVGIEQGSKRVFAWALGWPGWCRSGKTEEQALEALASYLPRYQVVTRQARVPLPADAADRFSVVDRVKGSGATDFGVPHEVTDDDRQPLTAEEARRQAKLVSAAWRVFDEVAAGAPAELRKGPRGGGRDRDKIVDHVLGAEASYVRTLGLKLPAPEAGDTAAIDDFRTQVLAVLRKPSDGTGLTPKGWPPRYVARRIAWHALDHAWEIEDRSDPEG